MTPLKNLILDMDGVLWRGETPLPGLVDFFHTLQQQGINVVLATNNASKTIDQYIEKLARFGVTVAPEQILTSAEVTAAYLSERHPPDTAVYLIGEEGLHNAFASRGFHIITPLQVSQGITAPLVVLGFNRHVTYNDLAMGCLLVREGATFYGTNPDITFPHELGPLPGAGSLLAVIQTATGVTPTIIGKPEPIIFQEALKRLSGTPANTAMVGDRLNTDIAGGKGVGLHTILLLSGISTQAEAAANGIKPDYIFQDITELAANLIAPSPGKTP